jgi:hypothetical protein
MRILCVVAAAAHIRLDSKPIPKGRLSSSSSSSSSSSFFTRYIQSAMRIFKNDAQGVFHDCTDIVGALRALAIPFAPCLINFRHLQTRNAREPCGFRIFIVLLMKKAIQEGLSLIYGCVVVRVNDVVPSHVFATGEAARLARSAVGGQA